MREKSSRLPAGRPRLIAIEGNERLLDDQLTETLPAWSSDSAKVATAFETDVAIYDAVGSKPTQARIPLRDGLVAASVAYDEKSTSGKKKSEDALPANPAEWLASLGGNLEEDEEEEE